jgi:hypothetical protein
METPVVLPRCFEAVSFVPVDMSTAYVEFKEPATYVSGKH